MEKSNSPDVHRELLNSSEASEPNASVSSSTGSTVISSRSDALPPVLPDNHGQLLEVLTTELKNILPTLCRDADSALQLPLMKILPSPPDLKRDNLQVVKIEANFTRWKYLNENYWVDIHDAEQRRERTRKIVVDVLDHLMTIGAKHGVRLMFTTLNFSHTEASMRAIFNGMCAGRQVHRETEVEILNLSYTQTSPQALMSLFRLRNLRELYLDFCPSLLKTGKQVFSLLTKNDPIPKLELLSVIGTSSDLSHQWFEKIEKSCPALNFVFFTRKKGTKMLGLHDVIMLQTMRRPNLLPCGHIGDKESTMRSGFCSLDRRGFLEEELVPMEPLISKLEKLVDPDGPDSSRWKIQIVDQLREPLAEKCLYHPECGTFYNGASLKKIFNLDSEEVSPSLVDRLKGELCVHCRCKLWSLRICYPHPAMPEEAQNFKNLTAISAYSIEGISRVRRDVTDKH